MRHIARFLIVFVVLVLGLSLLIRITWFNDSILVPYTRFITATAGVALRTVGVPVKAIGTVISHPRFAVDIKKGCDGLEATLLLFCATIAYPFRSFSRRLLALGTGYVLIFVMNMIRVVGLFLLGYKGWMGAFDFVHTYVAQFAIVTGVMILWLYWVSSDRPQGAESNG